MEFHVDVLGPCRKKVAVTVPPERVREELDRQIQEINDAIVFPGFRKGRAPRKLLERRFGQTLGREVKEKLVQKAMEQLVEEKRVDPLQPPRIDVEALTLEPEKAFAFEFELVTKPEFETPAYEGLEVKVPAVEVATEDVDRAVEDLRRHRATLETVEAPATAGDVLVVDWEARSGDSVEARDDGAWYPLGRGTLGGFVTEGLDEALDGKAAGDDVTAKVHVAADDVREELRGRDLELHVHVAEVKRAALPEVDADFLKALDYDDAEEMRDDLEKRIRRARLRDRDRLAEDRLVEGLVEGIEMSLPEDFVERELAGWAARKRVNLQMEGTAEDEIERQVDAGRADARTHIERDMRRYFLLDRLADKEEVQVSEAELLQAIRDIAQAYGRPEEEVLSTFRDGGRLAELASQIRHRKTREILRRKAVLVEEAPAAAGAGAEAPAEAVAEKPAKKTAKKRSGKKKSETPDDAS